ncbi:MAG: thioesterase family protein [Pirellulales bacterium]
MPEIADLLREFPVVIELPVQWGDQDAFGHVNNVIHFRWFESSRIAYLSRLKFSGTSARPKIGPILAAIRCDYRQQLNFPDSVHIGARITRIGRSSMTMEHRLVSQSQQRLAAEGESTVVVFDYTAGKPHPVPEDLRKAISELEGKEL